MENYEKCFKNQEKIYDLGLSDKFLTQHKRHDTKSNIFMRKIINLTVLKELLNYKR